MDSDRRYRASHWILVGDLSTPCNGFFGVLHLVVVDVDVLSTPCNGFLAEVLGGGWGRGGA